MTRSSPTESGVYLRRRPITYTRDYHDLLQRYGWAHRPDAVYTLARLMGINDTAVIDFARWMAWRVPTTSRVSKSSPLRLFLEAFAATTPGAEVPSLEQAVAALDLANIGYAQRGSSVSLAVQPFITESVVSPSVEGNTSPFRFLPRIEVTEKLIEEAYEGTRSAQNPSWFPRRQWLSEWDDAVAADKALRKNKDRHVVHFDPFEWVRTRGVDSYQRLADSVVLWMPTTDEPPLFTPSTYQYRPTAMTYKHVIETETGDYTAVGDFILAAYMVGLRLLQKGSTVYASVPAKYALTLADKNLSSPFHGTPRTVDEYGRTIPADVLKEGICYATTEGYTP